MRIRAFVVAVSVCLLSVSARAEPPKPIRDKMTYGKVDELAATAITAAKTSCGAGVTVTVDKDSFTKEDSVDRLVYMLNEVPKFAAKYCTDASSKKEFAAIKAFQFKANPDDNAPNPVIDGSGVMTLMVPVSNVKDAGNMQEALEKFLAKRRAH